MERSFTLSIQGMSCGSCAASIESSIQKLPEITDATVNFLTASGKFTLREGVAARVGIEATLAHLSEMGYKAKLSHATRVDMLVGGMSCASCANYLEKELRKLDGVVSAQVNFATSSGAVTVIPEMLSPQAVLSAAIGCGYKVSLLHSTGTTGSSTVSEAAAVTAEPTSILYNDVDPTTSTINVLEHKDEIDSHRRRFFGSLLCTIPLTIITIARMTTTGNRYLKEKQLYFGIVELLISIPSVFYFGKPFFAKAIPGLRHLSFTMDTLISVGVGGAFIFSVCAFFLSVAAGFDIMTYFDTSAELVTFMLLGRYLESIAKSHTSSALVSLLKLSPTTALLIQNCGNDADQEEKVITVPASSLVVGSVVRVLAGEKIPVDGVVLRGVSDVDESLVTGESVPKAVAPDSLVVGGTINLSSVLTVRATRVGDDTVLAQIVRIVQEAQNSKPEIQCVADRVAGVFVPVVLIVSSGVFILWMVLGHFNLYPAEWHHGDGWVVFAFNRFLSTLVVACPCALGLATPTAIMVGTGIGAERGILAKSGIVLEGCKAVRCVIFDKTGTLTNGRLKVIAAYAFRNQVPVTTLNPEQGAAIAALESQSTHPVAKAITSYLLETATTPRLNPTDVIMEPGRGVSGKVGNSTVHVGSLKYVSSMCLKESDVHHTGPLQAATREGATLVAAAVDESLVAIFLLADEPKEESRAVVEEFHRQGFVVMMVSGDSKAVVQRVAAAVGIPPHNAVSECLPAEKVDVVRRMQEQFKVAFVGDGVNDSPALAQADVGIAVGTGTDVAIETADAVLMKDSLIDLLTFFKLSRTVVRRIHINFGWAFGYNLAMIPAAGGLLFPMFSIGLPPVAAGVAMICSSLSVLGSSLALRFFRPVVLHSRRKSARVSSPSGVRRRGASDHYSTGVEIQAFASSDSTMDQDLSK